MFREVNVFARSRLDCGMVAPVHMPVETEYLGDQISEVGVLVWFRFDYD
jgi:hypothetical protein